MSQNLLVEQLKYAKRELTDLKTAHRRGLGLLKVYVTRYQVPPATGSQTFFWLTIDVEFGISNYPFAQKYLVLDDITASIVDTAPEFEYTNGGYGAEFRSSLVKIDEPYVFDFYSTSPIISISHSWSPIQ